MGALARVDADLAQRMAEQIALYNEAVVTGTIADLKIHADALKRGYAKCVRVMEASGVLDDAYLIGLDTATGLRVAIGDKRASAERVAELHGSGVVWMTADEIARLWASIQGLRRVDAVKEFFPGAEVISIRPHTRGPHSGLAEVMPGPPPDDDEDMVTLEIEE